MLKGITALREGINAMLEGINALRGGINTMLEGINALREGMNAMLRGINALREGINTMLTGGYVPFEVSAENAPRCGSDESSRCCASRLRIQVRMSLRTAARIAHRSAPMRQKRESGPGNCRAALLTLLPLHFLTSATSPSLAQPEGAVGYEAVRIEPLDGDDFVRTTALSDSAWIVVESVRGITVHPCAWVNGILYELPTPIGFDTPRVISGGISPTSGIIVGQVEKIDQLFMTTPVAWVAGKGTFVLQRLTGWADCNLKGVNDSGTLVGNCWLPVVATLWRRSDVAEQLGPNDSSGAAINRFNEVAGEWNQQACVWANGQMTVIHNEYSEARDLNDHREVVIHETIVNQGSDGHLWRDGQLWELPDPGGVEALVRPQAINNARHIVGYGTSNRGDYPAAALWWGEHGENTVFLQDHIGPKPPAGDFELSDAFDVNNAGQIIASGGSVEIPGPFLLTPYNFNLSDPDPGIAGQVNTIQITGLQPGQRVRLAAGFIPGAQALPNSGCLGGLLLIQNLKGVLPPATADNSGTATFIVNVPASLSGQTLRLQAYDSDTCTISHSVDWTF